MPERVTQCKMCNWERVREAERLYATTGNISRVVRWAKDQGFEVSYNAVRRHLQEHFSVRLGKGEMRVGEAADNVAQRAGGMIQELDENIRGLRSLMDEVQRNLGTGKELRAQAGSVARLTEAMVKQIDTKAKMLGYYSESAEVNLILVREFKQQIALMLGNVPRSVREQVLSLVEEHAARLPLQEDEGSSLEAALHALDEGNVVDV